jgi:hypothetical protein
MKREDLYSVPANNWFDEDQCFKELRDIGFAVQALAEQSGTPGSFQREMAMNASIGIKRRIAYLHDSLKRVINRD